LKRTNILSKFDRRR